MGLKTTKMLMLILFLFGLSLNGCGGGGSISVLPSADEFQQHTNADVKIDILFVVDDSGSMAGEQQAIYDNFREFIALFYDKGFDFRIAVAKTSAYGTTIACKLKVAPFNNRNCTNATTGTYPYYKKDAGGAFVASDFIARESGLTPKEFRCGHGNNCGLNSEFQTAGTITGAVDEGGDTLETTFGNGTPGEDTDHILASSKLTKNEMIDKFKKNILVGLAGTGDERGIESAEMVIRNMKQFYAPASQFPRPNAHLAVIHVGDEGDGPIPNPAANRLFGSNKGALTTNSPTCTYSSAGPIICNSTWGSLRSSTINSNVSYDAIDLVSPDNYVLQDHLNSVASYLNALKKHEATATISVHAIEDLPNSSNKAAFLPTHAFDACGGTLNNVGNGIGYFQAYMAHLSGGQILSKCNDFAQSLALLGDSISSLASSFLMQTQLDERGGETLKVYIEGINGNKPIPKGDVNGYVYDLETNRITFYGSMIPPQGALIGVTYTCATFDCQ